MVGEVWTTHDSRFGRSETAHLIASHRCVRAFALPWHIEEWVVCPWCGDHFTQKYVFLECRLLHHEGGAILRGMDSHK